MCRQHGWALFGQVFQRKIFVQVSSQDSCLYCSMPSSYATLCMGSAFAMTSSQRIQFNPSWNMQGRSQPVQPQVEKLEKELARLRQDGQAYRDDLTQQLEAAKQAATQARHDAAQASSQAAHEANQVQLLQSDRARIGEMADSWRKQAHENQACLAVYMNRTWSPSLGGHSPRTVNLLSRCTDQTT